MDNKDAIVKLVGTLSPISYIRDTGSYVLKIHTHLTQSQLEKLKDVVAIPVRVILKDAWSEKVWTEKEKKDYDLL